MASCSTSFGPKPLRGRVRASVAARGSLRAPGAILLLSTYELGRPPHATASMAAFLDRAGFDPRVADLAVERLDPAWLEAARLVVLATPMHTALRLAIEALPAIREARPRPAIAFAGHYAALHRELAAELGVDWVLAGELEGQLVAMAEALDRGDRPERPAIERRPLGYPAPRRRDLSLEAYARYVDAAGTSQLAGYTETTRGCLDSCRHCPVPAIYRGRFVAIDADAVLADVAAQVAAGARHVSFGDPDFLNGPTHALRVCRRLHRRWPELTFDFTAQVTHLLERRRQVAELVELGASFAVTAVESLSDRVLEALAKRHRRAQVEEALELAAELGLPLRPTLVPFTPWTEMDDLVELADWVARQGLAYAVAPVQLSIRLLVPPGSLLLQARADDFGPLSSDALSHRWRHADPRLEALQAELAAIAAAAADGGEDDARTHARMAGRIHEAAGLAPPPAPPRAPRRIPRISEPWFC